MSAMIDAPTQPSDSSARCPLRDATDAGQLDSVAVADLQTEYLRQFGINVQSEFESTVKTLLLLCCRRCRLEFFHPSVSGSPNFYAQLSISQAQSYYSATRWEFKQTIELIKPDARVIDVGCGDGYFLSLLPQKTKLGLELNPDAASRAVAKGLDVRMETLGRLPSDSADVITMFQVLEHMTMPRQVLSEAVRVLRPDGLLMVAVPNNDDFIGVAIFEPLNFPPHHPLRWTSAALRFLTNLYPLALEQLKEEPLAQEHVFIYRRTRITQLFARCLARRLPLMKRSPPMVLLRKFANLLTMISMRCNTEPPRKRTVGQSYLAVYRKKVP